MLQLPHGCTSSAPSISPKNWNTKAATIHKDWYIQYYFHDPAHKAEFPRGKFVVAKNGINRFKTLKERQQSAQITLQDIIQNLLSGYNPITGLRPLLTDFDNPHENLLFADALQLAAGKMTITPATAIDLRSVLKYSIQSIHRLQLQDLTIQQVRRKHCKSVLDDLAANRPKWSAHSHNKYRAYLLSLFGYLIEIEACDINPVREIKKQKIIRRIRVTVTATERTRIDTYLSENFPEFRRFLHIFFHSGGRPIELLQIKAKDVNLQRQTYRTLIKKGQSYTEKDRTIKDIALPLWAELMAISKPEDYLFSEGLMPGAKPIRREQVTRRWEQHVKGKLGIKADLYSLKHSNLDETAALLDVEAAAAQAGHSGTAMVIQHYAIGESNRQHERLKKVDNQF